MGFSLVRPKVELTFLLGLSTLDGVDGSNTGLVLRLFENFLRFRLSAANAPNPSLFHCKCNPQMPHTNKEYKNGNDKRVKSSFSINSPQLEGQ